MALEKTIYIGTFIHCATLTELDVAVDAIIGVDEYGKIAFFHRDTEGRQVTTEDGWDHAKVVKTKDHGFLFPGFIGALAQRNVCMYLIPTDGRYAYTRIAVSQCWRLWQVNVVRLAKHIYIPVRVFLQRLGQGDPDL